MADFNLSDNFGDDTLDVRDIIERLEELRAQRDAFLIEKAEHLAGTPEEGQAQRAWDDTDEAVEEYLLEEFLETLAGCGGDHQWNDVWYPVTLIKDSYFKEYAEDLVKETYPIDTSKWPFTCIDWDAAANELQQDYSSEDLPHISGDPEQRETYWYR